MNIEHPNYYIHETEMCDDCEEEFPTHNGVDFFCSGNSKQHNFCCETCIVNSWMYYFNIIHFRYADSIKDFIFDNNFTCSHPDIFDSEWKLYREHIDKMAKLGRDIQDLGAI